MISGVIPEMKINDRLRGFEVRRQALLDELARDDPSVLRLRPGGSKWSVLEIVEHLVLAERDVLQGLPESGRLIQHPPGLKSRIRYWVVLLVLRLRVPVKVPSPLMSPKAQGTLEDWRIQWDRNQEWLRSYLSSLTGHDIHRAVFAHPVAGPLDVVQTVRMLEAHFATHERQIHALKRQLIGSAPHYPTSSAPR